MATIARSQNGWPVHTAAAQLVPLAWITGRVDPRVHDLFDRLCARFDAEVEPIIRAHSWGWANRPIRGSTQISNHASGTAIDLNAPAHPLGAAGTFTKAQTAAIRRLLADFPQVRWGGDYAGRPDEMHFEINVKPEAFMATPRMASPARGRATSPYGPRKPIPGVTSATFHAGQDIANDTGTPIYAAFAGTVRKAGWGIVPYRSGYGILIANPDGEGQYYGHLSKIRVKRGQRVARGERIGDMGATGNVTGPHLHFETWAKATNYRSHYNPLVLFKKYGVRLGSGPLTPNPPKTPPTEKDWSDMVSENEMQKLLEANNERLISDLLRTKQPIYGALSNYTDADEMTIVSQLRYAATAMPDGRNFYQRLMTRIAAIEANQRGITAKDVAKELAPQLLDGLADIITDAITDRPDAKADEIAAAVVAQFGARLTQED